jgi:hypothetical protein
MLREIKPGKRVHHQEWSLHYDYVNCPGSGYSFPCDQQGNVLMDQMMPAGLESLKECRRDEEMEPREFTGPVIVRYAHSSWQPTSGKCDCGRQVFLYGDTKCECGRWYNAVGQELRPPREWGEDTGERFDDTGHCYYNPQD